MVRCESGASDPRGSRIKLCQETRVPRPTSAIALSRPREQNDYPCWPPRLEAPQPVDINLRAFPLPSRIQGPNSKHLFPCGGRVLPLRPGLHADACKGIAELGVGARARSTGCNTGWYVCRPGYIRFLMASQVSPSRSLRSV